MMTAPTFDEVVSKLSEAFKYRYEAISENPVRMVALVFAPPGASLMKDSILPNWDVYHHRSGNHIDFFFVGYSLGFEGVEYVRVAGWRTVPPDQPYLIYSANCFEAFRQEVELRSTWHRRGGCQLLLLNARYNEVQQTAELDFSSAVQCYLDEMKRDEAFVTLEDFFERIIGYAESSSDLDPTWGFSDAQGIQVAGSALKRFILSLLPKKLGDDARRASHFAVVDLSVR